MKKLLLVLLISLGFVGLAVAEIFIPANSHKSGTSWICNTNYYRNIAKTGCRYVPANSTSSYSSNVFKCNTGYSKSGNSCKSVKANEVEDDELKELKIEIVKENCPTDTPGCDMIGVMSPWSCKEGYIKSGNECKEDPLFSQEAIEREIAFFEAQLEAELAAQELMAEIEEEAKIEAIRGIAQIEYHPPKGSAQALVEAIAAAKVKRLWVADIATKVKSYWNYSGADDDWSCNVMVHQNVNGKVLTVNIQDCNTGSSDNALMADDKVRAFMNSIERAVYKASPLPIAPHEDMFDRQILFRFSAN